MNFVGRQRELQVLKEKNWRDKAQLIVVYGRRRVGKTRLIEEAYKQDIIWKFEGLEGASERQQIQNFIEQLARYSSSDELRYQTISDWHQAFGHLSEKLVKKRVIVFFDEFQWLACMKGQLVSLFKYYWDNHFSKHRSCRFIICGSMSSFIVKKVLRSKALYGRVDTELNLLPLSIKEAGLFFPQRKPSEVIDILMTFGGIPQYLLALNPDYSYLQNLNEYAFAQNGYFFHEFGRLFISHFSSTVHYEKILITLSNKVKNMDELAKACGITKGGAFADMINDLVLAGFVEKDQPLDKSTNSKIVQYRLLDEYLHFYFSFIHQNVPAIQKGEFQYHHLNQDRLRQWQGYAFERLCRRSSREIADFLKFSGVRYVAGSWFRRKTVGKTGAQVDLMFKRDDKVMTVCEIKYVDALKGKKTVEDFEQKIKALAQHFPSHGIQKVLILGKTDFIPAAIKSYFDHVLFAEELFF